MLDRGHLLENMVACELARHYRDLCYVRTNKGLEVDFLVTDYDGHQLLIQVAASVRDPDTLARETRALLAGAIAYPDAECLLLAEDDATEITTPQPIKYVSIWQWLLIRRSKS